MHSYLKIKGGMKENIKKPVENIQSTIFNIYLL